MKGEIDMSKGDAVIMGIQKQVAEALAPRVGNLTVTDLMAFARVEVRKIIPAVFKEHGLDSIAIGALPEGAVFQVHEDPDTTGGVKVHLYAAVREAVVEAEKKSADGNGKG